MNLKRRLYRRAMQLMAARKNVTYATDLHIGRGSLLMAPDSLVIKDRVKIGIYTSIIVNGLIEDGVQISSFVSIVGRNDHIINVVGQRPHNAPWIFDNDYPPRDNRHEILLEQDCWIGWGATILSGVTIGRGAVIGAGAVVVKDVPPYSIASGNPARAISRLFTEQQIIEHESIISARENIDLRGQSVIGAVPQPN